MNDQERIKLRKLAEDSVNDLLIGVFQLYDIYTQFLLLENDPEKINTPESATTFYLAYKELFEMMWDIADSRILNRIQETVDGITKTPYNKDAIIRLIKLNNDSVNSFMNDVAYNEIFVTPEEV